MQVITQHFRLYELPTECQDECQTNKLKYTPDDAETWLVRIHVPVQIRWIVTMHVRWICRMRVKKNARYMSHEMSWHGTSKNVCQMRMTYYMNVPWEKNNMWIFRSSRWKHGVHVPRQTSHNILGYMPDQMSAHISESEYQFLRCGHFFV